MTTARPAAVIVLAAGEGTRMKSAVPKVLHSIGGRTLLGHAIAAARGTGAEHLSVVVRHERDLVAAHVAEVAPDAVIADQDEVKGTGRATECALDALPGDLDGTVLVTYGDVPLLTAQTLHGLVEAHTASGSAVTVVTATLRRPDRLRPDPARRRRLGGRDRRAEGRHGAAAGDHRDQLRHLRLRGDRAAQGARPGRHGQRPGREVPHRRAGDRPRRGAAGGGPPDRGPLADRGRQRPGAAGPARRRAEPPDRRGLDAPGGHRGRPGHDLDRHRREPRPRRDDPTRRPSCTAPRRSATTSPSAPTPRWPTSRSATARASCAPTARTR